MVLKKKEQRARLEMGNKLDKIPAANEEVQEWETKLDEGQANFVKVSDVVKAEIDFFERYRVKDFKSSIIKYMEELMECQTQMVHYWEDFLPEVKNSLWIWILYLQCDTFKPSWILITSWPIVEYNLFIQNSLLAALPPNKELERVLLLMKSG